MYTHMCTHTYTHIDTYTHIYTHIHTYTHIYTRMHARTHTHTPWTNAITTPMNKNIFPCWMLQQRADRSRSQHTLHYSQSPGIVEHLMAEEREGVLQSREEQQVQKINHTHHLQCFAVYKEQIKSNSINNIYTYMFVFIRKVAKFRQHKTCKILDLHVLQGLSCIQ